MDINCGCLKRVPPSYHIGSSRAAFRYAAAAISGNVIGAHDVSFQPQLPQWLHSVGHQVVCLLQVFDVFNIRY
uniref:Uncharacterized protein n=1 Tax=Parascaris univalens TaxID=6257 RepID=A0A915AAB0_PARUN